MKLTSKNKRILVLADPHQEVNKLDRIIEAEAADEVVCLGDWFDSFFLNSPRHVENTCKFLINFLNKKNYHTLIGNHDLHYFYPSKYTICSGYTNDKRDCIDEMLGPLKNHLAKKFKWYIQIDDFLCTHAGVSSVHFFPYLKVNKISDWLDNEGHVANLRLQTGEPHWFYEAGKARSGKLNKGGIVWLDFDTEFEPIEELKQIVGHTYGKSVRPHHLEGSLNPNDWKDICVDCNMNQYLIIHNNKIEVKNYIDL